MSAGDEETRRSEMDEPVLYRLEGATALLTLNRPERLNAFNPPMLERWVACLEQAQADPAVRAIVLTGAGRGFCSGGDVSRMGAQASAGGEADDAGRSTPLQIKEGLRGSVQRIPLTLQRIDKPVIAAINGAATGAGLDMALMCDIRFAAAGARLGETYSKVGLVPGAGGAYFLPRLVGTAKALELFWTGDLIDAEEALRVGMVNRVYPAEQLMPKTLEFAERIGNAPPLSIRLIKRAVYQSATLDLATSLDLISSHMTIARSSRDHVEAIAALREKRAGRFEGR
jgi:enoyl-CoA hydratase/carnithine racemase